MASGSDASTIVDNSSNILIKGGDVKFMKAMQTNAQVQVMSTTDGEDLDFCLYDYREQLSAWYLKLKEDSAILAYLKN